MSLVERLIEELERDSRSKKRLAELLVSEPDVRLALINAVIADVATRRDLESLRRDVMEEIKRLEDRGGRVESGLARVDGQLSLFIKLFIAFNLLILLAVIGILLRLSF